MSKIDKELIESYRKIVLPFVSNKLYKTNFEGQGEADKIEFEQDFNAILDLAVSALHPTGDLISRDALKIDIDSLVLFKKRVREEIKAHIDKAPAVKTFTLEDMQNNFDLGAMSEAGKHDRPKGEWNYDEKGYFYCERCGRYPHDQYATTDFCPKCGADMRKGGQEE